MTLMDAIRQRRSIRKFEDRPISAEHVQALEERITQINEETGLHIQLITDRPEAFKSFLAHYGGFRNAANYIALVGKDTGALDEACGYYGEDLVLFAQTIGLSTCWVGGTFSKKKAFYEAKEGEKLCLIIAIGYAAEKKEAHKSKKPEQVMEVEGEAPQWFMDGVRAALLAPTAINQQKFTFILKEEGSVEAKAGKGPFSQVDLGIVKYHFEIGSGRSLSEDGNN